MVDGESRWLMQVETLMKQGFKDVSEQQFGKAFTNSLSKSKVTDTSKNFAEILKQEIDKVQKELLRLNQELDELINSYYMCRTDKGRILAKVFIEGKRKELEGLLKK